MWLRTRVCHSQSLDAQCTFLKARLCIPNQKSHSGLQQRNNKPFVLQSLGCYYWKLNWTTTTKSNDQAEQSGSHSLLSSTSASLSSYGTYCRCLPTTTVVTTCAETVSTTSTPATIALTAVATCYMEITSSFINMCLIGLGTEPWASLASPRNSLTCWVSG